MPNSVGCLSTNTGAVVTTLKYNELFDTGLWDIVCPYPKSGSQMTSSPAFQLWPLSIRLRLAARMRRQSKLTSDAGELQTAGLASHHSDRAPTPRPAASLSTDSNDQVSTSSIVLLHHVLHSLPPTNNPKDLSTVRLCRQVHLTPLPLLSHYTPYHSLHLRDRPHPLRSICQHNLRTPPQTLQSRHPRRGEVQCHTH